MKGLLSTGASRAWVGVALAGLVMVVLVFALSLLPRLGAGQRVIDAAGPAFSDARVTGTEAAMKTLSQYVDVIDPLLTRRGGGPRDSEALIVLMKRKLGLTTAQVRKVLRREAPHFEALTRALPLAAIADEVGPLTAYLATILGTTEDEVGATLERDFPHIAQALTALRNTADAWYDVPGIDGLTRLSGGREIRTLPGLRTYYRDDVVPLLAKDRDELGSLAGTGGVGYIPYLLLVLGTLVLAMGVLQARRAAHKVAPGTFSWSLVVAIGVFVILLVVAAQYFPRFSGAQQITTDFKPVFTQERVRAAVNGTDSIHEAVNFGDPIMTAGGGAAAEVRGLYRYLATRTGRSVDDVRRVLRRRAPRTSALFSALPLSDVADELPELSAYLKRALRPGRGDLDATLRARTPALAQVFLALPAASAQWNAIPSTDAMKRFDGLSAVTTVPQFDEYLSDDLVRVLADTRQDVQTFASKWPPVDAFAPLMLILGLVLMLYGGVMMQLVARRW
jgi:hypothetical protein